MMNKILLSFMILSTFGIFSSGIGSASAYSLDVVTLGVFGDISKFIKKTGEGMACVTSSFGKFVALTDRDTLFDKKLCENFP